MTWSKTLFWLNWLISPMVFPLVEIKMTCVVVLLIHSICWAEKSIPTSWKKLLTQKSPINLNCWVNNNGLQRLNAFRSSKWSKTLFWLNWLINPIVFPLVESNYNRSSLSNTFDSFSWEEYFQKPNYFGWNGLGI